MLLTSSPRHGQARHANQRKAGHSQGQRRTIEGTTRPSGSHDKNYVRSSSRILGRLDSLPVAQGPARRLERADEDAHVVRPRHDRPRGHRVVAVPGVGHVAVQKDAPGALPVHLDAVTSCILFFGREVTVRYRDCLCSGYQEHCRSSYTTRSQSFRFDSRPRSSCLF